jgi:hypothetical protein
MPIEPVSRGVSAVNYSNKIESKGGSYFILPETVSFYILSCVFRIAHIFRLSSKTTFGLRTNFRELLAAAAVTCASMAIPSHADAASYYVDSRVAQSGSGEDWTRAWKSFDAIQWSRVRAGDIISISGGTSGLTYTTPLTARASGLPGSPIRIVRATSPGRNGRVLIDGRGALTSCVVVDGVNHVSIENLTIANCTEEGIRIRNARDVVARGNSIYALSRGFHIWRTTGVVILSNNIGTPAWDARQTDGIYSQENVRNSYFANNIVISNSYPDGHDDGIQSYRDRDILIARNYVEQRNRKTGNALGIFLTDSSGVMTVVNNIVVGLYTQNSLVSLLNISNTGGALKAYNNTLIGSKWGVIQIENAPASTIANNILYSTTVDAAGITIAGEFPPAGAINYNVYYLPNGRPGYRVNGASYDWGIWRATGYEARGIVTSIPPVDASFAPVTGSVAVDTGIGVTQVDQKGRGRPRGARFDIGALERP